MLPTNAQTPQQAVMANVFAGPTNTQPETIGATTV